MDSIKRSKLIAKLQELQNKEGYLSLDGMKEISKKLNIPLSKIYGVSTFYNQFKFNKPGRYHIQICRGTACHVKGSESILDTLERALKIKAGETTPDGLFSLEIVACVGACSLAPVVVINGEYYAKMTNQKIENLLKTLKKEALSKGKNARNKEEK